MTIESQIGAALAEQSAYIDRPVSVCRESLSKIKKSLCQIERYVGGTKKAQRALAELAKQLGPLESQYEEAKRQQDDQERAEFEQRTREAKQAKSLRLAEEETARQLEKERLKLETLAEVAMKRMSQRRAAEIIYGKERTSK